MIEKPLHTKKELKRLFMDLKNKGITDEMMGILIEVLWRDKTSSRSAGFFWPGGPDLSLNWDDVTRTLTLTPAPALDPESGYVPHFRFFSHVTKPVLHRRYNPESIILPNEEGLYAIYYDVHTDTRLQALTYTKNPDEFAAATIIMDKALVAWIYWDAVAGKALYFGDSRYGSEWPPQIHFWAHKTLNSLRQEGLAITDATYEGTGLFESDTDFEITAGKLWHEDIFAEAPEVPLGQEIPVWYFDQTGLPRYTSQAGKKILTAGSGLLAYNPPAAGIAEASDLNYVVYHYFATNCVFQPHIAVMGQNKYTLRSIASAAIASEVILLKDSLPHSNLLHIGSIVFQTSHDYANSSKARAIFGTDEVGVTSIFTEEDPDFPIDYLKYIIGNKTIDVTDIFKPNGILAGGYVSWSGGLSFFVTPVAGRIMRELYKILTYQSITLTAADPTYPRIDLIVMDNTPSITFLTGIPAENPQKPTVDPARQIELTHVLVPAAASEPAGVTGDIIFDENSGEWVQTVNGVIVNFDYSIDSFSGLKCADVGSIGNNDTILFTASAPLNISDYETFIASLKLKEATTKQHILYVEFMLLGAVVSSPVTLLGASVSLDWQVLALKFANITFNAAQFDAVRLRWNKSGAASDHPGFLLDRVKLEKGITQPVTGADGKDGATWYSGTYHDPLGIGKTGDWFFDTGTVLGDIYECTGGPDVWTWRMNIAPRIGVNGNWLVNNQDTGIKAEGVDGITPHIGLNDNWWIGETDIGVKAIGTDGVNGSTPEIGLNGNWWIDGVDTGILADASKLTVTAKKLLGRYSVTDGPREEITVGYGLTLGDDGVLVADSVVDSYIVSNEAELIAAWDKGRLSTKNTTIYIVGVITLTANRSFIVPDGDPIIAFEGAPRQTIEVQSYRMDIGRVVFRNITFSTNSSVYLWLTNGYAEFYDCAFSDDVLYSTNISNMKTHISIFGSVIRNTGRIIFDKVQHFSQSVTTNNSGDIQPVIIRNTNSAFANLYIQITNMPEVIDYDRFSRVLLLADVSTPFRVTGDLSWYHHPAQDFSLSTNMLKKGTVDDLRADYIQEAEVVSFLGITSDNKIRKTNAANITASGNVDGGRADEVYTIDQLIDGGAA